MSEMLCFYLSILFVVGGVSAYAIHVTARGGPR